MKQVITILEAARSNRGWSAAMCSNASRVPIEILEQMFKGRVLVAPPRLRGLLRLLDESDDNIGLADREAGLLVRARMIEVWRPNYLYIPRRLLPCSGSQQELRRAIAHVVKESKVPRDNLAKMSGISRSQLHKFTDINNRRHVGDRNALLELMRICGLGEHGVWNIDYACSNLMQASDVKKSVESKSASPSDVESQAAQESVKPEEVVTDGIWERLEPILPTRPDRPGRKRADDRAALEGILYVVRTGVAWNALPTALFGVSGWTCWRRLKKWHEDGIWYQLHERLLFEVRAAGLLDLESALLGWASPVDRRRLSSNTRLITGRPQHPAS